MHTRGPWKLLKFGDDEHYVVTDQSGTHAFHRELATVGFGFSEPAETEQHANAKLIAAAPAMLAALQKICDDIPARPNLTEAGRVSLMADAALAAINKATA